ncbi:hypothetical protein Kpol_1030p45 [Vanderwaltozyma polyspora DSM 70294]|uniref:Peroxisomal membrane protein PEX13 n=1 Tax=Vanderwaltozyma polyspora (strain ATCC 22028 / DSM 70294 / BCRC 21397 / CBS 2163 / NBRC 10782 / NRRL Y-8283 / UCD 57-17) TaxID=436907 RepID=A7TMW3_VANPO|nr:uncharacterized protein Kpol_1030p45 [Vanderwaltozyma polyspora DSM 70294]EDO16435.1 hypothetical protein Kpol_1030p45 [Vanderwaltozyma polyspora DSM 70294]
MSSVSRENIRPKPWETKGIDVQELTKLGNNREDSANILIGSENGVASGDGISSEGAGVSDGRNPDHGNSLGNYNTNGGMFDSGNQLYRNMNGLQYGNSGLYRNNYYDSAFSPTYGNRYGGGFYGNSYGSSYGSMYGSPYGGLNQNNTGVAESTQATFQLIESIIGAFTGFAQMLESTYMATHNSFFTMVSVAEQFNYLKEAIGSFFGIFALMKVLRKILHFLSNGKIKSIEPSKEHDPKGKSEEDKKDIENGNINHIKRETEVSKTKKSKYHIILSFLSLVFGLPIILSKIDTILRLKNGQRKQVLNGETDSNGTVPIEFARACYDFTPENNKFEVPLNKDDIVAVLRKQDALGRNSNWWKVQTKDGKTGYVPYNYIEVIRQKLLQSN